MTVRLRSCLFVLLFTLCGCEAAAPSSAVPDATALPVTAAPLVVPSPAAATARASEPPASSPQLDPLLIGSAVRVAVPELNLRESPSLTSRKVAVLTPDDILELERVPADAGGYTWYFGEVISTDGTVPALPQRFRTPAVQPSGWIAVAKGGTSYVTRLAVRCPATVDLLNVEAELPAEHLACFGSSRIVLQGTFGCGGCGGYAPGEFEPRWLAYNLVAEPLRVSANDARLIALHFSPNGPARPSEGAIVKVTGHFDDPAAQTCRVALPPDGAPEDATPVPIDEAVSILFCRQEFVVDSYAVLGVDPGFMPG